MSGQTMNIESVVNQLAAKLNVYAGITSKFKMQGKINENGEIDISQLEQSDVDELNKSRNEIALEIASYQPKNDTDGIFPDIVSVITKISNEGNAGVGEQFDQIQFNILNDTHKPLDEIESPDFYQALASRILLGMMGMQLFYIQAKDTVRQNVNNILDKINDIGTILPEINIPHIEEIMDTLSETTKSTIKQIDNTCNETIKPRVEKVIGIFELIKNTALQLFNATATGYVFNIWSDRKKYVNNNGELVDDIERIRLENLVSVLQEENCRNIGKEDDVEAIYTQPVEYERLDRTAKKKTGIGDQGRALTTGSLRGSLGGKSKKRRKSGKRKTRRKQKKRKTRRKRRCKK